MGADAKPKWLPELFLSLPMCRMEQRTRTALRASIPIVFCLVCLFVASCGTAGDNCPNQMEKEYFSDLGSHLRTMDSDGLHVVLKEASDNLALLLDTVWQERAEAHFDAVERGASAILEMPAPDTDSPRDRILYMALIHSRYQAMAEDAVSAIEHYRIGVEGLSPESIDAANVTITSASEHLAFANEVMSSFCD